MPKQIPTCIPEWFARFLSSSRFAKRSIDAITFGHTINYREIDGYDDQTPAGLALLAHELKHVEQFERDGRIGFYLNYLRGYLRSGYGENIAYG